MLSSYPLCLEWIKDFGGKKANLIAVGTFLPQIEIWNLDLLDVVQPEVVLGEVSDLQYDEMGNALPDIKNFSKQNKKKEKAGEVLQGHTDAVLSLSVNPFQ